MLGWPAMHMKNSQVSPWLLYKQESVPSQTRCPGWRRRRGKCDPVTICRVSPGASHALRPLNKLSRTRLQHREECHFTKASETVLSPVSQGCWKGCTSLSQMLINTSQMPGTRSYLPKALLQETSSETWRGVSSALVSLSTDVFRVQLK